jgi:16S rRNA (uracil1498-N3)-methyltransferase
VHRLKAGDVFVAFDPERALEADAELVEVTRGPAATARIGEARGATVLPARKVTLLQAAAKGDKMDAVIRDATELGATRIVPVIAERSVSRPEGAAARADRYRRVAVQAARQCGRGDAPRIDAPMRIDAVLGELADRSDIFGLCLDPTATTPLRERLTALQSLPTSAEIVVVVGPEGGLTEAELAMCERAGIARVSLGPLTLRTETVCAAVLGTLLVLSQPDR